MDDKKIRLIILSFVLLFPGILIAQQGNFEDKTVTAMQQAGKEMPANSVHAIGTDSEKKFVYKKRNPNRIYYQKLQKLGKEFDFQLAKVTHEIVKKGGYITATLPVTIYSGKGKVEDIAAEDPNLEYVLFLGYSTGDVVKISFTGKEWDKIKEAEILTQSQERDKWTQWSVTCLAYEGVRGMLFVGYGDKTTYKYNLNIGLNLDGINSFKDLKNRGWTEWISCDPDNLLKEEIRTNGGGIRRYSLKKKEWDYSTNITWGVRPNQTAVQSMHVFQVIEPGIMDEEKIRNVFMVAMWGNDKSPQNINYGFELVPVGPYVLPIPTWSGGDTPDPKEYKMRIFQVTSGDIFYKTVGFEPDGPDVPTAMVFGNKNDAAMFMGYRDGRVNRLDLVTSSMGSTIEPVVGQGWAHINKMLFTEFNNTEYILVNPVDATLQLIKYKSGGEGSKRELTSVTQVHNNIWGSKVKIARLSDDGKRAVLVLENSTIQWFDFETESPRGEIIDINEQAGRSNVATVTAPYSVPGTSNYRIFVSYTNGNIKEFVYDGAQGKKLEERIIRARNNYAIRVWQPNYGVDQPLRGYFSDGWSDISMYFYCDDLDFDPETNSLFCYTAIQQGIVNRYTEWSEMAAYPMEIGMGIDVVDLNTGEWQNLFPQKIQFGTPPSSYSLSDPDYEDTKTWRVQYDVNR